MRLKVAKALLMCMGACVVPCSLLASEEEDKLVRDIAVLGVASDRCKLPKEASDHAGMIRLDILMETYAYTTEDVQNEIVPLVIEVAAAYSFDRVFHDNFCTLAKQILKEDPSP